MPRDANTLEVAYRESFVNPIIPKAFEDVNDKIRDSTTYDVMQQNNNLNAFKVLVYLCTRETIIYTMHRCKGGLHIVDILTNFTIPDNKDQSRVIDYYLKLQEISRKAQKYAPSNENPLEASPSNKKQQNTLLQKESKIEEIIPKKR
ncbi:643_t:CDS:2 [Acaulospora colombiana]|uniref:643_t:CDS:1 n=1 Tax=Acaulospora colombiana TaxID=27376 RepID=A0ACA9KV49_9GLOM|nr:643_t:CDS:2 [Acaulospora colombiana]